MMDAFSGLGRALIVVGLGIVVLGLILTFVGRLPGIGRLPGDIVYRKGNFTLYFPLVSSLLLSVVLTILIWLIRR